ncbi:hypothetical protein E2C01_051031 [Portunus trituberculatus]|uniref:Uncharacterized protein n=1 Tax=Portunus trituberculatus TaxID=210409 RepID=A0A5B7G9W6_PORTR|nr:hypothetical protein [Portunus trituberculatus]
MFMMRKGRHLNRSSPPPLLPQKCRWKSSFRKLQTVDAVYACTHSPTTFSPHPRTPTHPTIPHPHSPTYALSMYKHPRKPTVLTHQYTQESNADAR